MFFAKDEFLLPDDDPRVLQYLDTLKSERDKKLSKDEEKEERLEKWMALHMSVAEKRHFVFSQNHFVQGCHYQHSIYSPEQ